MLNCYPSSKATGGEKLSLEHNSTRTVALFKHSAASFYQRNTCAFTGAPACGQDWWKTAVLYPRRMQLTRIFMLLVGCLLGLANVKAAPRPQEPAFEIPVQLIGFPVIIGAVRLTNFLKKLSYSLNPETYVSRVRRALPHSLDEEVLDVGQVEKKLIEELGSNVCVYERICSKYAARTLKKRGREQALDWENVFSKYKTSPDPMKENYLLSVFLGNIVGSPRLCHQLAKRGRACNEDTLSD